MKNKFILQIYRHGLWEDLATYLDKSSAIVTLLHLRSNNVNFKFRCVEVYFII